MYVCIFICIFVCTRILNRERGIIDTYICLSTTQLEWSKETHEEGTRREKKRAISYGQLMLQRVVQHECATCTINYYEVLLQRNSYFWKYTSLKFVKKILRTAHTLRRFLNESADKSFCVLPLNV